MRHHLALVATVLALAVCVSGQVNQAAKPFLDTQIAVNVRIPSYFLSFVPSEPSVCRLLCHRIVVC